MLTESRSPPSRTKAARLARPAPLIGHAVAPRAGFLARRQDPAHAYSLLAAPMAPPPPPAHVRRPRSRDTPVPPHWHLLWHHQQGRLEAHGSPPPPLSPAKPASKEWGRRRPPPSTSPVPHCLTNPAASARDGVRRRSSLCCFDRFGPPPRHHPPHAVGVGLGARRCRLSQPVRVSRLVARWLALGVWGPEEGDRLPTAVGTATPLAVPPPAAPPVARVGWAAPVAEPGQAPTLLARPDPVPLV